MRTRTWYVALVLLSLGATAGAQTTLSETEALARLSAESPRVRAIRAGVDMARAEVLAASRWPNPRVTYNRESVAGVTENMLMVTQALPLTGRRTFEIRAASALVEASERRADDDLRRARAELRAAYADLVSAQVRETELARARDRLRELTDVLGKRESGGESAGYDRIRAEREVIDIEGEWSLARAERAQAQAAVAGFFADPGDVAGIVAVVPATTTSPLPQVEQLLARAEMVRGELQALRQEIEAARFAERAAQRRGVPEPEVVGGTKTSNVGTGDVGSVVSLHLSVPLFDRGQPERAQALARQQQAEARLASFQVALRAQVTALRSLVAERREAAARYRASSGPAAGELERIAQVSYEAGERGILELLDAYRTSATARTRQATLDAAVRQAEIELEFVSGWEFPE